jgi:hypothetical protein
VAASDGRRAAFRIGDTAYTVVSRHDWLASN